MLFEFIVQCFQSLYCTPWNCYYSNQSWILKWKRYHRVSFWTWVYWITFYTEILLYLGQTFQTHRTTHIVVSSIFVSNNLHGFSKPPVSKIWILLKFGPIDSINTIYYCTSEWTLNFVGQLITKIHENGYIQQILVKNSK